MKRPLVLIIDDNLDNILVVEEMLKKFNCEFNSIPDPTIVLDILEYQRPDLILLDYFMPEQDGLETLNIIKGIKKYANIPVIVLTADTEKETLAKFFQAGAVDFLNKPINYIELESRVSSILKITRLTYQLKRKMAIVRKQNNEINMFTNMIFNDLDKPLKDIKKYSETINSMEDLNLIKIKEFTNKIKEAENTIRFKIDSMVDAIGVMEGKDLKLRQYNKIDEKIIKAL